jgi:hypothetical protein
MTTVYDFTLKRIAERVTSYLADYAARKFTGRIVFAFDFRDGGVAHIGIETKQSMARGGDGEPTGP